MNNYDIPKKIFIGALASILIFSSGLLFKTCSESPETKFMKMAEEKGVPLFSEDYNVLNIKNYFLEE